MPKPKSNSITLRGAAANDFVNGLMAKPRNPPYTNEPLAFEPVGILQLPTDKNPALYIREPDGHLTRVASFTSEANAQRVAEILAQKINA